MTKIIILGSKIWNLRGAQAYQEAAEEWYIIPTWHIQFLKGGAPFMYYIN